MGEAKRRKKDVVRVPAAEDERIAWQGIAAERRNLEAEKKKAEEAVVACAAALVKVEEREELCRADLLDRLEAIPSRLQGSAMPDYPKVTYDPASVAFLIRAGKAPDDEKPKDAEAEPEPADAKGGA